MSINVFHFPGIVNGWVIAPLAALTLAPFVGVERLRPDAGSRVLIAMLGTALSLAYVGAPRVWPIVLLYACLGYLACSCARIARARHGRQSPRAAGAEIRSRLPLAWLVTGIIVLAGAQIAWALHDGVPTDVGMGSVAGATRIVHGQAVYGESQAGGEQPHTDTYGPANYELYVPFAASLSPAGAARIATLFFVFLTALLLFALGAKRRDTGAGVAMAYCWLAFPVTAFESSLGFNDALVAASLVAVLLALARPAPRGALAAVCCWTKFSPLALLPLWATCGGDAKRPRTRSVAAFSVTFVAATCVIFVPVAAHNTLATFASRTFGYQSGRVPVDSLWGILWAANPAWLGVLSRLAHGVLLVATAVIAISLPRMNLRRDTAGVAAASAVILIMVEGCLSYFAYSYVLWFAPLVIVALWLAGDARAPDCDAADSQAPRVRARRRLSPA
ncbi:MAG TPA: glycosyltransferase 87 family protein [Solirubrobacteraceae bacterium]|nr:glycosyltransferase 87 family protein [Solirubrobacteraceae bacterium]